MQENIKKPFPVFNNSSSEREMFRRPPSDIHGKEYYLMQHTKNGSY
tara:strand:- start:3945 stop:4082 length:138 start_codon:yes stop_codon:yes gene_type:complete